MAGEEMIGAGVKANTGVSAILFLSGCYLSFDAMSTINSSPWTHETFSSAEKMAAGREYVAQAIGVSFAFGAVGALVGHSPWPLIGVAAGNGYLYWLYHRAFDRATAARGEAF